MIKQSKRGPKCRCIDCHYNEYESDGEDYSWYSYNFCNDDTEQSWAWKNGRESFISDKDAFVLHRCKFFEQKYCRGCGRKIQHGPQLMADCYCERCDWEVVNNMVKNRPVLPKRAKKPGRTHWSCHNPTANYMRRVVV